MKVCKRGEQNFRMLVETVFSMLTTVCHFKKITHRVWEYFTARVAFTMAAFNILTQWYGLPPDKNGFVHYSYIRIITLAPKVTTTFTFNKRKKR